MGIIGMGGPGRPEKYLAVLSGLLVIYVARYSVVSAKENEARNRSQIGISTKEGSRPAAKRVLMTISAESCLMAPKLKRSPAAGRPRKPVPLG